MKKKKILFTLIFLAFLTATLYLQFGRAPIVNSSITTNNSDGYEMILTVTANKLLILNPEKYATTLVSHIITNEFQNQMFSYDELGYPNRLRVTVYTNESFRRLVTPAFSFHCETSDTDPYNMKIILDTK